MKKYILLIIVTISCSGSLLAQKASEVLEKGIHVKAGEKIYLQIEDGKLKYDLAKSQHDPANTPNPMALDDNSIFLITGPGVNIYAAPVNPLNYAYTTSMEQIVDPINEAAATAMSGIIDKLTTMALAATPAPSSATAATAAAREGKNPCGALTVSVESQLITILKELDQDQKAEIAEVFRRLKALGFDDEGNTRDALAAIRTAKSTIETHFAHLDGFISSVRTSMAVYNDSCSAETGYFVKSTVYNMALREAVATLAEQKKRLSNLQAAYNLVNKALIEAGRGVDGVKWLTRLDLVSSQEGKINVYTITLKTPGYSLSDAGEIEQGDSKELQKITLKMRRFQRFVPEVSAGVAYTFFKYNTYKSVTDSAGVLRVAPPVENAARNINITSMINWVYHIPNSNVRPLYQLGLGINGGVPTLVTGGGLRTNIDGRRIAITGGVALTWLRELDKLSVGDAISGEADIEQDLKYEFVWPPKGYIGLQYNF